MKVLNRDYPTSFIVAHEVNFIDHEKMSDWWSRKRAQQLSAETTRAWFQRRVLDGASSEAVGKRK